MSALTPGVLRTRIATGDLAPVYLLLGDDEREKESLAAAFTATVDQGLRAFNVDRFRGGEAGLDEVLAAARIVPVVVRRRIVIVVRAEAMLQPARESEAARDALAAFEEYLAAPSRETTLVLLASGLDERRRISKQLRALAAVVGCGVPGDAAGIRRWIRERLDEAGRQADDEAVRLLSDLAGHGTARLRNALDRLLLFVEEGDTIGADHVREMLGPSAPHATDDWAVARAIEQGVADRALRELGLALDAGAVPHMILGQLAWVARTKLAAARIEPAIEAVFRTDLALKQSGGEPRVLLERLVVDLCGTATARRRRA